jgi:hypothetical protein
MRGIPQGADAHPYIYTQQLFRAHFFTLIIVTVHSSCTNETGFAGVCSPQSLCQTGNGFRYHHLSTFMDMLPNAPDTLDAVCVSTTLPSWLYRWPSSL